MGDSATGMQSIELTRITPSKVNPRRQFDGPAMQELQASIAKHGVLQPVLVRPVNGAYELVAGERRFRAAKAAGLKAIPATVRAMTDQEVLEVMLIENLQRADLHQLEEADGYRQLLRVKGYDAAKIAERIGRSVKYVYDRIKLLNLIEPIRTVFLEGRITAGHAILLARLTPKDQARVMGKGQDELGGLWQGQRLLWDPDNKRDRYGEEFKAVSVRELEAWIAEHVRFDAANADAFLFPETVMAVKTAKQKAEKVVHITHEAYVQPEARDATQRIIGPRSWERADGKKSSKSCDHAVTGVIVVGPDQGQAFKVCINKEKCKIHWASFHRERAERVKQAAKEGGTAEERYRKEQERRKAEESREQAQRERYKKALPTILEAVAEAVKKAPTRSAGFLAECILDTCSSEYETPKAVLQGKYLTRGTTAEDLVRYVAFLILATAANEYDANEEFPKKAKALGIDVKKILDEVAPVEQPV